MKRNKFKDFVNRGCVTKEEYNQISPFIRDENLKIWKILSLILIAFSISMVILAIAVPDYFYNGIEGQPGYIKDANLKYAFAYSMLSIFSVCLALYLWIGARKRLKSVMPIIDLSNALLLIFFASTSTTLDRANCSVIFCALLVATSLLTVRSPLKSYLIIAIPTTLFLVLAITCERVNDIWIDDIIYGVVFACVSIIFANFFNIIRIKDFSLRYYIEQQRDIDSLTGVRSKMAYDREVSYIMEKLYQNRECEPFALAVFDVNGLKLTNDTYGHELGDELLRRSALLIGDFFKNSVVYRIGGDEFAVIARGEDYRRRNEIVRQFRAKVYDIHEGSKSLLEDIPIACGLATYDPKEDIDFISVFSRADTIMYDDKRLIKSRNKFLKGSSR